MRRQIKSEFLVSVKRIGYGFAPLFALLFALACLCIAPPAFAKRMNLHPPDARAAALAEVMQEQLALSPEQAKAVRSVAEKYAEETDEARAQYTRRKLKKQIKAISEARDAAFKGILTAEQFASYEQGKRDLLKAMKDRMKGAAPDPQAPAGAAAAEDEGR